MNVSLLVRGSVATGIAVRRLSFAATRIARPRRLLQFLRLIFGCWPRRLLRLRSFFFGPLPHARGFRLFATLWLAAGVAFATAGCFSGGSALVPFGPGPDLAILSVTDQGTLPTTSKILGRDGGYSGVFQSNVVWLYGDTFLAGPDAEGRGLISDSWSYTTELDAQDGITGFQERLDTVGAPTMILTETPAEQAFDQAHSGNPCAEQPCGARFALWPSSIIADTANNRALIFYMLVSAAPGNFNFHGLGNSVAIWQNFQGLPQRPTINPPLVADHPDLLFSQGEPNFGSAALMVGGTLYVYGCGSVGSGKECMLGRVNPGNVLDRTVWTFLAGNGNWSPQLSDAISVFSGDDILNVSWNAFLQRFVAIYSQPLSENVMIRTAPNPEGPWSGEMQAFTAMQPAPGGTNVHDAQAHPEYNIDGGRIMFVTYSRATGAFTSEVRLVALELAPSNTQAKFR